MDDPSITMKEYIRIEEEKARRHGKVYNWETATYGKIWYDEDDHDLRSVGNEFSAIVLNDVLTSEVTLSCEPTVSSLNNEIDFRISFDEFDDEDYTTIFDKNSFSYKIISANYLKTDSKNDNDKVNMPSFPSPKPTISYFDDLDYFKDFEKEFPAIVYNDALTSILDFLTEPTDNDDDKVNIEHSSRDLFVKPLPDVINTDVGAYAHGSNKLLETSHDTSNSIVDKAYLLNEYSIYDTGINTAYPGVWIRRIDFLYSLGELIINEAQTAHITSLLYNIYPLVSSINRLVTRRMSESNDTKPLPVLLVDLKEPAPQMAPIESPQMVSTVKLPMLKKVILNGDGPIQTTKDENGVETKVSPKTAQAILTRQRERKDKSIFLLAIPDAYQLRFHAIKDANTLWAAIKSWFGGLDKAYDRFQKLISLLEVHSATVSNEDANQKFLRALPSSWNNIALIIRNKEGIDELDIDDLYNNLKVFKADIKGSSVSSLNSQNVVFLFAEDTSSSNKVNTANGVSTIAGHSSQGQASYVDDLMFTFFTNQSNSPQLDDEDLEQIDHDDLEEMDLKWQVAMLFMRVETSDALVIQDNALIVQDGLGYEWSYMTQDKPTEFALIAYTSSPSGSDTELSDILESVEASDNSFNTKMKLSYEEKIGSLRILINSQLSAKDKTGLGYGDQMNENDSSGSEVFYSVFDSRSSDGDDNQTNDRFKKGDGYHAVPSPITGNYMPPLADLSFAGLDDSV
ncbi:hypothetical protein Tco_0267526 [Tanacetum coccineum]